MLTPDIVIKSFFILKNFKYDKNIGIGASKIIEMTKGHESKGFNFTLIIIMQICIQYLI